MKKILFIETSWCNNRKKGHHGGIDTFRILIPSKALNKYSKKYKCESRGRINPDKEDFDTLWRRLLIKEGFDGVIVKNIANPQMICQLVAGCHKNHKKLIVDLDDDLFHLDEKNPAYKNYIPGSEALQAFRQLLKWSDGVIVENEQLRKTYVDFRTYIVPNCIDGEVIKKFAKYRKSRHNGRKISIGYFGSISHRPDIELYTESIAHIMRNDNRVVFVFYGGMPHIYNFGNIPKDRIRFIPPEDDYPNFLKKLAKLEIDIGIAPLKVCRFNAGRSPIKYFEYAIAGIPVIAQGNLDLPYRRVIEHGQNGLLFKTEIEFIECMEKLIENPGLGEILQKNALENIEQHTIQNNWEKWENTFDKILGAN